MKQMKEEKSFIALARTVVGVPAYEVNRKMKSNGEMCSKVY